MLVGGNAAFIYTAEKLGRKKYALLGIEKNMTLSILRERRLVCEFSGGEQKQPSQSQ